MVSGRAYLRKDDTSGNGRDQSPRARTQPLMAARGKTFASLRFRNYRLYFIGQSGSIAGNWMQNVALAWLVLEIGHSGTALGIFTGLRFLPLAVLGPWGGAVTDRHDKWRMLVTTQICMGLLSGLLALFCAIGTPALWLVMLMGFGLGVVNVFDNPARQSFINDMVSRDVLANAIALNSVSANIARAVGPLFSGVFIASLGVSACFGLNAVSFGGVIVTLLMMDRSTLERSRAEREPGQVRAGLRYVRDRRTLLIPLLMIGVVGAFTWEFQVTLPLLAKNTFHGGAWTFSLMLTSVGIGAGFGGLLVARTALASLSHLAWAALGWGIAILAASAAPDVWAEYILLLPVGYGTIAFNSMAKTSLQLATDTQMRGRVMALWAIAWQGTTPVGGPIVGWIGETAGARWSLVAGGLPAAAVGATALMLARSRVRPEPGANLASGAVPESDSL